MWLLGIVIFIKNVNVFNLIFDVMKRNKIETLVQAAMKIYHLMLFYVSCGASEPAGNRQNHWRDNRICME